ncbi:hypothetical protein [Clostridium paridis]|uniref:Uncharacterized protein n=1 Tax=Clostridium paridis TaxID=2803863 RepID=A0A937FHU0_9CLOT|nr:hypothetical protein [Clostridium paridis]MBL4932287.1 hypothetical protein [Clostridium paridis]
MNGLNLRFQSLETIVNDVSYGDMYKQQYLVKLLINGGYDEFKKVTTLFEMEIASGNERAKEKLEEVLRLSGLNEYV